MKKKENEIGYHNKKIAGKKAILTQEVSFHSDYGRYKHTKKYFPAGTVVISSYEVVGTGLVVFNFNHNGNVLQFPLREHKYQYVD